MRVRFHNIEQSFISGFEEGGGEDACGEVKQNVRQLLNVTGAAPCRVDFAGAVIEDNWEQSPRECLCTGTVYTCIHAGAYFVCVRIYVRARARLHACPGETRSYDNRTSICGDSCVWRLWRTAEKIYRANS